jgi:signal transduction histidine kinase
MHPGSVVAANRWQDLRIEHRKEAAHAIVGPTRSALEVDVSPMTQMSIERPTGPATPLVLAAERQRIAQELQGHTIHRLFAIGLKLQALSSGREDAAISERLDSCVSELDVAISDLRAVVFNLGSRNV